MGGVGVRLAYTNDQQAASLIYHDHAMGMTRLNVYAGLMGAYLIRDPKAEVELPNGSHDVPLILQDKSFLGGFGAARNKLYYPHPWAPEFFGGVMVVNGKAWPNGPHADVSAAAMWVDVQVRQGCSGVSRSDLSVAMRGLGARIRGDPVIVQVRGKMGHNEGIQHEARICLRDLCGRARHECGRVRRRSRQCSSAEPHRSFKFCDNGFEPAGAHVEHAPASQDESPSLPGRALDPHLQQPAVRGGSPDPHL
jgi:hypothetical protein